MNKKNILYKLEINSLKIPVLYIKAENIEDMLYKCRKYLESTDSVFSDELHKSIKKIELISNFIIE